MSDVPAPLRLVRERYGLGAGDLESVLGAALARGADYADVFLEHSSQDSVALEDGIVKSGDRHLVQGVGVRAQVGERQGYAHTSDVSLESLRVAAGAARAIAEGSGPERSVAIRAGARPAHDLYPLATAPTDVPVRRKIELLTEIDAYARSRDPRVSQVMASVVSQQRVVLVAGSDGTFSGDVQPLVRVNVQVLAEDAKGRRELAYQGGGGRVELAVFLDPARWKPLVDEAVRLAVLNLDAAPCPAGSMDVVLAPGWSGVLLHEAVGHGLEGDFNRKGTSAFAGRIGQRVAAPGVSVVDDGTLPGRRGSLNVDDEGQPTRRNVLIEDGILVGYLQDRLNAKLMGVAPTGNGRRESYAHLPLPRMTNTFMLAGEDDPEEIVRSVDRGLYAANFGGGQVDITSGKFVFSVSEAYRIEGGRLGAPVKGASLIGNGPDVLGRVRRIGSDLALDLGVGTCGKEGQSVPVGVGLPTLLIADLTVGGTEG
jgi:TldD protein